MKKIILAASFFLFSALVLAEDLKCIVNFNAEKVAEASFSLAISERSSYLTVDGFTFYLSNKDHSKFELDIYNSAGPFRSYAEGFLRTNQDTLAWSFWSRDVLVETVCKLAEK